MFRELRAKPSFEFTPKRGCLCILMSNGYGFAPSSFLHCHLRGIPRGSSQALPDSYFSAPLIFSVPVCYESLMEHQSCTLLSREGARNQDESN
jgi:hypothetical protein